MRLAALKNMNGGSGAAFDGSGWGYVGNATVISISPL